MRKVMGYWMKKRLSLLMAASLAVVSLPVYPAVQTSAAEQTGSVVSQKENIQERKNTLRGAGVTQSAAAVVFSAGSGTYREDFDLKLSYGAGVVSGAGIYYTTDGSDPSDTANLSRILYTPDGISIADRKGDPNVLSALDPNLFDAANVKVSKDHKSFESTLEKPSNEDVDKCTVIKAAVQYENGTCSDVATNTYFIGDMADHIEGIRESCEAAGMDLSVMSISMDAEDLFDSTKGIYVKGDVFDRALAEYIRENGGVYNPEDCRSLDANYKQKGKAWERETHIDYFESNGTETRCKLQQDCGIRIQGNYSRSDYQKSFRLYARAEYGEKNFQYGFWDQAKDDQGNVIRKYKKIVLRNGGNCAFTTKFSDAYWQSLMEGIDCDKQSARPCAVYLNGEYWGVYVLQDDFCGSYFENKHGLDKNGIVIYKGDAEANRVLGYKLDEGSLPDGVVNEDYYFTELENFMKNHDDVSAPADYAALCELVDKDSALDYFATEVWINNKWDWPGKNWSMWKSTVSDPANPYADGKWRFLVYDVEFGGISGEGDAWENTVYNSDLLKTGTAQRPSANWDKPNVRCFALFMTNPEFREEFKARLSGFSDTMFQRAHALERANQFKDVWQPILDQFFKRFPTLWDGKQRTADMVINGNGWDTYGTWKNIVDFVEERAEYIPEMISWIEEYYSGPQQPTAKPTSEPTDAPTAKPTQKPTEAPTAVPGSSSANAPVQIPLCDGAKKTVTFNAEGKVVSTKYQVEGITYTLLKNQTFAYSAENKKALKKKKSCVIPDVVVAGGNRYKVTMIEAGALQGLKKLQSVIIGENIRTIGKGAFRNCKKLKKITFLGKKVSKAGSGAFQGIAKKAKILCPKAKKKAYQKLIKKSGVNLKKGKITVTNLKQGSSKKEAADTAAETAETITMSSLAKGNGSYQSARTGSVVTISSAAELKMLSEYTKEQKQTRDITFRQTAAIDGTDMVMEPIGTREYEEICDITEDYEYTDTRDIPFCGTYDGAGYPIRNLVVSQKKNESNCYCMGMFGIVESAQLRNINLESVRFVYADTMEEFVPADNMILTMAAIAAASSGDDGTIENCQNHASLSTKGESVYLAGIIAYNESMGLKNCTNYGDISASGSKSYAAGIAALSFSGKAMDCTNEGNVNAAYAAGIMFNTAAGIIQCENTGNITGEIRAAGITGVVHDKSGIVRGCSNSGAVSAGIAGGIAACIYDGNIINSENTGKVSGVTSGGGIVGRMEDGQISAVSNQGEVTADQYAGGICGAAVEGDIVNAQNRGKVTADQAAGGIAGAAVYMDLGNLWNHGAVSGTHYVGGIVGGSDLAFLDPDGEIAEQNQGNRLVNCIQLGTVSGGSTVGSVIAYSKYPDQVMNCYCLDTVTVPVHGSDSSITAQTVTEEQWKDQSFLETLNQYSSTVRSMPLLKMQYDAQNTLRWSKKLLLLIEDQYGEGVQDAAVWGQNIVAENTETAERIQMAADDNGYYLNDLLSGVCYDIYRILADGTEKLVDQVTLREEDNIYICVLDLRFIRFYLDGTWTTVGEDEDSYIRSEGKDLYTVMGYQEANELVFPENPVKEGYEFAGWYSEAYAVNEESYAAYKEVMLQEYQEFYELGCRFWDEDDGFYLEWYGSKEAFLHEWMMDYDYATLEEFTEHYDQYFDDRYKVTELYRSYELDVDEDYYYVTADILYPRWIKKEQSETEKKDPAPSGTAEGSSQSTVDLSKYQDKAGNYVQKNGLIYKVNRKKKTAAVVGVSSKSLTKAVIVKKVKTGGKTYKVTSITKNAFKGCKWLKKISAKGKSLKKVRKKALKMIRKKV